MSGISLNNSPNRLNPYQKEKKVVEVLKNHIGEALSRLTYQYCFVFSKTAVVVNTDSCILLCPPPGKVSSYDECNPEVLECDTRRRVASHATKVDCCFFYASNLIREPIGPNYSSHLKEERQIEKRGIKFFNHYCKIRKQVLTPELLETCSLLIGTEENLMILATWNHAKVKKIVDKTYNPSNQAELLFTDSLIDSGLLNNFLKQENSDNVAIYLKKIVNGHKDSILVSLEKTYSLCKEFLETFDVEKDRSRAAYFDPQIARSLSGLIFQHALLGIGRIVYQLQPASWNPFEPADKLLEDLKRRGPHLIGGLFCQDAPGEEVGRKWTKHGLVSFQKPTFAKPKRGHVIVVIGVQKKGNDDAVVYFLDSADSSSPFTHIVRIIYIIAYKEFVGMVNNLIILRDASLSPSSPYALTPRRFDLAKCQ